MLPSLSLIIGGARSGKSAFAERLVLSSALRPVYLATAEAGDAEMADRIAAHRSAREGAGWVTVEVPVEIAETLAKRTQGEAVLLDCATLWLANVIGAGGDVAGQTRAFLDAASDGAACVVVVSNEVGQGIVPNSRSGRQFRDAQGALNQQIAARADLVVAVMAGLPLVLKGQLPEAVS